MKTLTEAMQVLKRGPEDSDSDSSATVHMTINGPTSVEVSPTANIETTNLVNISKDCSENQDVQALMGDVVAEIIRNQAGVVQIPVLLYELICSAFQTGFSYGVRIGMEMEKGEPLG
jgi:hypothetical protein